MKVQHLILWGAILTGAFPSLAVAADDQDFVPVFNGKDLSGWEGDERTWRVEAGAIVGEVPKATKLQDGLLRFARPLKDFELRFEVKMIQGRSGIRLHNWMVEGSEPATMRGLLVRLSHNRTTPWSSLIIEPAGLKGAVAPWEKVEKLLKPGDFNEMSIKCAGRHVSITLNGTTTVEGEFAKLPAEGILALEIATVWNSGMRVEFRNIRLRERQQGVPVAREEPVPSVPVLKGQGLRGEYFTDNVFDNVGVVRLDPTIDFSFGRNQPPWQGMNELKPRNGWYERFAVRWTGTITPPYDGKYTFFVTREDGALLWVNDELVVNCWRDKTTKQFSGQINLEAGKPVPVKLLYFNGTGSSSIKLEWSNARQKREVVPASALQPSPAEPNLPRAERLPSLQGCVHVATIQAPHPVKHAARGPRRVRPYLVLVPLLGGGFKIGWNDMQGNAHITSLTADLKPAGNDIDLPGLDLRGFVMGADGAMGVLAAELPEKMWCLGLDKDGTVQFKTMLSGAMNSSGAGKFLDNDWCFTGRLASTGTEYGVHFGHAMGTKTASHQGGYYASLDRTGKVLREQGWTASHNLDQGLVQHRGNFLTLANSDGFPLGNGLYFNNRALGFHRVVYPALSQRNEWRALRTYLGSMISVGKDVAVVFATPTAQGRELVYLLMDEVGRVARVVHLVDVADVWGAAVKIAPYGQNLLLAWSEGEPRTHLAIIDRFGRFLNEPISITEALPRDNDLVALPDGTIGWLTASEGETQLKLVRVSP